jgi:hypothetical protein
MAWRGYYWRKNAHRLIREERDTPSAAKAITARPYYSNGTAIMLMHLSTMSLRCQDSLPSTPLAGRRGTSGEGDMTTMMMTMQGHSNNNNDKALQT